MPTKAKTQFEHFRRRLLERHDIDINRTQYKMIVGWIRNGQTKKLKQQSIRVSIHLININGKLIRIVYDKKRKTAVTALP